MQQTTPQTAIPGVPELHVYLDFLRTMCDASKRPPNHSHGDRHMRAVYATAKELLAKMNVQVNEPLLALACLLHDVADPKYDKDGRLKVALLEFLQRMQGVEGGRHVWEIIKCASYSQEWAMRVGDLITRLSREQIDPIPDGDGRAEYMKTLREKATRLGITPETVRNHRVNWRATLCRKCGDDHTLIRNLLSEADKLEAMGVPGVYRCMRFGFEFALQNGIPPTAHWLMSHVVNHYAEKLGILYPHYFETRAGLAKAAELHEAQEREIEKLRAKMHKLAAHPELEDKILLDLHTDMQRFA